MPPIEQRLGTQCAWGRFDFDGVRNAPLSFTAGAHAPRPAGRVARRAANEPPEQDAPPARKRVHLRLIDICFAVPLAAGTAP